MLCMWNYTVPVNDCGLGWATWRTLCLCFVFRGSYRKKMASWYDQCSHEQSLSVPIFEVRLAWDHALSLLSLCLSREEGMIHFFVGSHVKKARIWTFLWLDRKQYRWFALFQLAKMPPSVSCCWFQSPFFACVMSSEYTRKFILKLLLAQFSWIWRMRKEKFHPLKYFHLIDLTCKFIIICSC